MLKLVKQLNSLFVGNHEPMISDRAFCSYSDENGAITR
jgi:hypothetical protein